jgi:hypothetical protein
MYFYPPKITKVRIFLIVIDIKFNFATDFYLLLNSRVNRVIRKDFDEK